MKDSSDELSSGAEGEESSLTASSLVERLKLYSPEAWKRLDYLFGPVVYQWCRQSGLREEDAADAVQDVFHAVATKIREFHRDRPGSTFRGWLWTIARNKITDHWRRWEKDPEAQGGSDARRQLESVPARGSCNVDEPPNPGTPSSLYRRALALIENEFSEKTWNAFSWVAIDGREPADVADELNITVNAVYIRKSRVLHRLRQELGDVLD